MCRHARSQFLLLACRNARCFACINRWRGAAFAEAEPSSDPVGMNVFRRNFMEHPVHLPFPRAGQTMDIGEGLLGPLLASLILCVSSSSVPAGMCACWHVCPVCNASEPTCCYLRPVVGASLCLNYGVSTDTGGCCCCWDMYTRKAWAEIW